MESNALTEKEKKAAYFKKYYYGNKDKIKAQKQGYSVRNKEKLNGQTRQWHKDNPERSLLVSARARAKQKGLPFDLEITDIVIPSACPILKLPLITKEGKRTDNTPSLDRVVPEKGYVKGNIEIISWRANRLKSDATFDELQKIVEYMQISLDKRSKT